MSQLKQRDFTTHCPCASTTSDYSGITVRVHLSIDIALFNVISNNYRDMSDYKDDVCIFEKKHNAPARLVVTRFVSWDDLKKAPSEIEWDVYRTALDIRRDYENKYEKQLKKELLNKYYDRQRK